MFREFEKAQEVQRGWSCRKVEALNRKYLTILFIPLLGSLNIEALFRKFKKDDVSFLFGGSGFLDQFIDVPRNGG